MNAPPPYDLLIGLDRSDQKIDLHLIDLVKKQSAKKTVSTTPESLRSWLKELRQEYPQARIAICLEQPALNLIALLEGYKWIDVYPINPIMLQKFREAFVTSRAKDDAKDAEYLAELLMTHHHKLKVWVPEDGQTRLLQQLVVHRRAVVDERTALTNRLQALLKQYFPQALELCGDDLWRPLATALLLKWPTLQAMQKAKPATLRQFYYLQGSRSEKLIALRLETLSVAVALTDEVSILESFALRVKLICRQLQLVTRAVHEYDERIAKAFGSHEDKEIFANLPGAGAVLAPRLLSSMGAQRERYPTANALQRYSGVAPVTKQSGNKRHVHRRYLCPKFMRQSFHEYAKESVLHCRWAGAFYLQQRIIWRLWQDRTTYDDQRYEAALLKNGSPLTALFQQVELGKSPFKNPVNKK